MNFSIFDIIRTLAVIDIAVTKAFIGHPTIASRIAEELLAEMQAAPAPATGPAPQPARNSP